MKAEKNGYDACNCQTYIKSNKWCTRIHVENVFSLPGVPSILKSMLGGLDHLTGGAPILSHTINLRTVEVKLQNL